MEMGAGHAGVAVAAALAAALAVVAAAAGASEVGRWRGIGGPAAPAAPAAVSLRPPLGLEVEAPLGGGSCGMCSKWMRKPIKKRSSCVSR